MKDEADHTQHMALWAQVAISAIAGGVAALAILIPAAVQYGALGRQISINTDRIAKLESRDDALVSQDAKISERESSEEAKISNLEGRIGCCEIQRKVTAFSLSGAKAE